MSATSAIAAASLLRCLRLSARPPICCQCRSFASSPVLGSGHNKWSKIKHEKKSADAKKNVLRSQVAQNLTAVVKYYGPESPQLATALAVAKKADVPKHVVDGAIARGMGRSLSGAVLESMTFEAIMPPSVGIIVEVETDNRLRTLQEINVTIKKSTANATSAQFLFSKVGRVVFERSDSVGPDEIMDDAIEAGAEDIDTDEDGNIVVWTEPSQTSQVVRDVGSKFGLRTLSSDIIWSPKEETMAPIGSASNAAKLGSLLTALRSFPEVQAIYSNASKGELSDEEWAPVEDNLDV